MRLPGAVVALTVAVLIAGCTPSDEPGSGETATSEAATSDAGETPDTASEDPTATGSDDPATTEVAPLEWRDVPGSVSDTVTASGPWLLTVSEDGSSASLEGPEPRRFTVPERHRITDALIDGEHAVVVSEDSRAQQGNIATVVELGTGDTFRVDGSSRVPTTSGGTWALGDGTLLHATLGPDRAYCLAEVDLASRSGERLWCAPPRHGFNDARVTPAGTSLLTFDDHRPSCRTVVEVVGNRVSPFEGVEDCRGWDGLLMPGGAAAWSVVPRASRIEEAHFHGRSDDGVVDLGPGTSGSLTWCAGAAYFVRDPQRDGDPAQLLRWAPGEPLTVVYRSTGKGPAFLSAPRCGGDTLTLSVLAESGDEQVAADLG